MYIVFGPFFLEHRQKRKIAILQLKMRPNKKVEENKPGLEVNFTLKHNDFGGLGGNIIEPCTALSIELHHTLLTLAHHMVLLQFFVDTHAHVVVVVHLILQLRKQDSLNEVFNIKLLSFNFKLGTKGNHKEMMRKDRNRKVKSTKIIDFVPEKESY